MSRDFIKPSWTVTGRNLDSFGALELQHVEKRIP